MKKYLTALFAVLLALSLFSCSASPTAIKVGSSKVDASEYAYYLNYNRLNLDSQSTGTLVLNEDELLAQAREKAKEHIITAEIVRMKCKELDLKLSDEQKSQIKEAKDDMIDSFGGLSGYLDYLKSNYLTDRLYDKLQENSYYYSMLYEYIAANPDSGISTDQELRQYFSENYIKVKYIRFNTTDETGSPLPEEELKGLLETANSVLTQINKGDLTFDAAMSQYNDVNAISENASGIVVSAQDGTAIEYITDAFALTDGQCGGVYTYSDGYYILLRQPVDAGYYDENREQIVHTASDWAFNNYVASAKASLTITVNKVCQKINFENLKDYVK
ncbi:MAG: hypothetical protein VB078_05560 [Clostridiaceae bacterium]|nr:hypothetical protein [Clostridiaceae bacterium]